jgi:hypothetical protein
MPLPVKRPGQSKKAFMDSCLSNPTVNEDFPDTKQRYAVCTSRYESKRARAAFVIQANGDELLYTVSRITLPPALIEKLKGMPESSPGKHKVKLKYKSGNSYMGTVSDCEEFETDDDEIEDEEDEVDDVEMTDVSESTLVMAAKNEGKTLNKPFRLPKGSSKKFGVYVKNDKGNIVVVKFGDPNMEIKRDDPERRSNFRSRHGCDNPGPKTGAKFWSCFLWRSKPVSQIVSNEDIDWDNLPEGQIGSSIETVEENDL